MQRLRILMIDDDTDEHKLVQYALEKSHTGQSFFAVTNVRDGIRYLRGEGEFSDRDEFPFPNIVLCDLNMDGRKAGFEFLTWVKRHAGCSVIPTMIYSSSGDEDDVKKAYQLGANAYVAKPTSLQQMVELIQATCQFWNLCQRPLVPANCGREKNKKRNRRTFAGYANWR